MKIKSTRERLLASSMICGAAFAAFSETSAFDRERRVLTGRPAGWDLTRYDGVGDGWDEFDGYYRGVDRIGE